MPFLAPVFGAVAAFAGTAIGQIVIGVAGSLAVSLLQGLLNPPRQPAHTKQIGGVKLDVQYGDTGPLAFPIGYSATAGTLRYKNSWGNSGDVPNAFLVEVRQLSDLPISGLNGIWINGEKCTILWAEPDASGRGYPVSEYRRGGVDHFWVKFFDGSQTVADTYLTSKFSTHPTYPWTSAAVGYGVAYAVTTALWNRDVWTASGAPTLLFEPGSIRLYDIRKDSTAGGSGSHRWNNPATWEPSLNTIVAIYNIIRGIRYGSEWLYGGQTIQGFQLPAASWMAAMNECDVPVNLDGGGTEPQFRCGAEIECDVEPLSAIEQLLQTCNGRLCEIGGIFEIMVGAPGAAVYSFTDNDILISRGQSYSSFPGLAETRNAIEANYPEPNEKWASKASPTRYYPEFEAEDGARRLATGIEFPACPFRWQIQRVADALVRDDRRWRTHSFALPPDAWVLTGTSVVNWTSERNGYVNKKFLVSSIRGEPGMCQTVVLREIDPSDYVPPPGWQMPNPIGVIVPIRPGPQTPTGFQAFPATFKDAANNDRRPSIQIVYDGNMPDIQSVHVLVRLKSSGAYVFEGFIPFEPPYSVVLNATFLPNETYEVAIRYVPYSARETLFTAYQEVTTPNIRLGPLDVDIDDIANEIKEDVAEMDQWTRYNTREEIERRRQQLLLNASGQLDDYNDRQSIRQSLTATYQNSKAQWTQDILVAAGPNSALALSVTQLRAEVFDPVSGLPATNEIVNLLSAEVHDPVTGLEAIGNSILSITSSVAGNEATGLFRIYTSATPAGANARIALSVAASAGASPNSAAIYLDAMTDGTSRIMMVADRISMTNGTDTENPFVFTGGVLTLRAQRVQLLTAGLIQSSDGLSFWNLDTGAFRISA